MKITLGFSPCPNDTFIFDALVHHKIDTEGLEFEVVLGDIEELNQKAFNKELDITKLSYHAYGYLTDDYVLLDAGSALGKGCGPILVQRSKVQSLKLVDAKIAIPGKYTTANFLLSIAHPEATNKTEMLFSDIENAILTRKVDAGLLIHENRFTYKQKGLEKIIDLGEYWENTTGALIPLGGIVMKRSLDSEIINKVNSLIRKSIEYAFENKNSALAYMQQHAQEMDEKIMMQHVALYVNKYSIDLGEEGRAAVTKMFNLAQQKGVIPEIVNPLFVNS
ncbi:MAG: 1,4-dihydroxy-6-naphthoate synthase [Flavobacteriales bacterium]|nr:1,4-dihydroxy-6-naphthoate synthase [Flavobacteriales bacterium]MCW8913255.1 1,4-dihydroxy-6-naphthoate synthase [Flavobacteriales bacterium]MCW8938965.1 1,4-dihydroxy-6-naphthoate synthase [Flavobacteriales bacterium]MCW8939839.1 1,4-dihydroxy-6-naphthoate synthase [Flavobacteriales bacterium]MCW8968217.1 1,4-dihydroxy-6-naphthoate synthase [Flavobacteriales bacterium]